MSPARHHGQMRRAVDSGGRSARRLRLLGALLAVTAGACSYGPALASASHSSGLPRVRTGPVTHASANSALLTGTINAKGHETTFYFQYGPTVAYGSRTASAKAGSGTTPVKVGQLASPFFTGYHYRLIATNSVGTKRGRDRTYTKKSTKLKFELFKPAAPPVIGTAVTIRSVLTGLNNAHQRITLQASPFPFHELSDLGLETVTNTSGRFTFHVGVLTRTTRFRVVAVDMLLPVVSKIFTEQIAVRVSLHVRPSGRRGFVRLYGTVTPAEV